MKVLVLVLAVAAVAQAGRNWSQIKHKDLRVAPLVPPPFHPKIVGGESAERHQFPHQVALFMDRGSFCGGSIIRDDVVLTAAHCAEGANSIEVVAGAHYIQQSESTQQSIRSSRIVIHEDWDRASLTNDIALVFLSDKLNLDGVTAKAINLRQVSCPDSALDGAQAIISGWGRPSDASSSISPVLRFTTNAIVSNSLCNSYFGIIIDSHICFGGTGGRGGCNGDSGGPMTVVGDDGIEEVGIASFVSGWGCEAGYPTAYTRVSCFADWIQSQIA